MTIDSAPNSAQKSPQLEILLELQQADTSLTQLIHRRANLPERGQLESSRVRRLHVDQQAAPHRQQAAEFDARLRRIETEVAAVEAKIVEADRRLFSGVITAPRELQALQADIASLKKRRSELEDTELETMIEREPIDAALTAAAVQAAEIDVDEQRLIVAITEAEVEIDALADVAQRNRDDRAAAIPEPLLALYERVRTKNRGVAAARLEHGTCMSCRLKLSAVELDRIRRQPADAVVQCEECGAILIR